MDSLVFTQLSIPEVKQLFRQELENYFESKKQNNEPTPEHEELLTVPAAAKFLSLSVPTIYGLIHRRQIPVMKRSKRCYFSKTELLSYLKDGRKKTIAEIKDEANEHVQRKKVV